MPPSRPFVDRASKRLDTDQIVREAIPLAKLIGLVALVAFVPFVFATTLGLPQVFTIVMQFVLAVGSGLVLLYVVARGIQLAEE